MPGTAEPPVPCDSASVCSLAVSASAGHPRVAAKRKRAGQSSVHIVGFRTHRPVMWHEATLRLEQQVCHGLSYRNE